MAISEKPNMLKTRTFLKVPCELFSMTKLWPTSFLPSQTGTRILPRIPFRSSEVQWIPPVRALPTLQGSTLTAFFGLRAFDLKRMLKKPRSNQQKNITKFKMVLKMYQKLESSTRELRFWHKHNQPQSEGTWEALLYSNTWAHHHGSVPGEATDRPG